MAIACFLALVSKVVGFLATLVEVTLRPTVFVCLCLDLSFCLVPVGWTSFVGVDLRLDLTAVVLCGISFGMIRIGD